MMKKIQIKLKPNDTDQVASQTVTLSDINKKITTLTSNPAIIKPVESKQTITIKNGQIIDSYCQYQNGIIYQDYNCTLNLVDIQSNMNKFYIMLIVQTNSNEFVLMKRYGRVGEKGQIRYTKSVSPQLCADDFKKTFFDKTKNKWELRQSFHPVNGKYQLCDINYGEEINKVAIPKKETKSQLDDKIQHLLTLIGNQELLSETLIRLEIDAQKMPLGKISPSQIQKAYTILKQLQLLIQSNQPAESQLMALSSQFYMHIPCTSRTRTSSLPIIKTSLLVNKFFEIVDELSNLYVATQVIEQNKYNLHPLDHIYNGIQTTITHLSTENPMHSIIETYIKNSHAPTHTGYRIQILNIYVIDRKDERQRYENYCKDNNITNKMLLWHGTRLSNYLSILKMGLILRPDVLPGTYISGKMFSYGIYGANSFSKSFNYTGADHQNNVACLFLAEFGLGNVSKRTQHDYYITEKSLKSEGYNSVHGCGQKTPSSYINIDNVIIPQGKLCKSINSNECSLLYDEFVVYNENQLNLKYIVEVKAAYD